MKNQYLGTGGIEINKAIPEHEGVFNVANTLRAIVDILESGDTRFLKGFRDDFICTDEYNSELFDKVAMLKDLQHWDSINKLMKREFMWEWDSYCAGCK